MREQAVEFEKINLLPGNWVTLFGMSGMVNTPIGEVKMSDHQYLKMSQVGRNGKLGMVKPTLEPPDIIIDYDENVKKKYDRDYSYVFVKSFFRDNGVRYYNFTSITVKQGTKEVSISNEERSSNRIAALLQEGKLVWVNKKFSLHPKAQIERSVSLNDASGLTITDSQSTKLGIHSSEPNAKIHQKSETTKENQENISDNNKDGYTQQEVEEKIGPRLTMNNYDNIRKINPFMSFLWSDRVPEFIDYREAVPVPTLDDYFVATKADFEYVGSHLAMQPGAPITAEHENEERWADMVASGKYEHQIC